jgi:hypothetical protein
LRDDRPRGRHNRARRCNLRLTVGNLRDTGSSGPGRGGLRLSIANLRHDRASRGYLRLTVGDLRDTRSLSRNLGLTVGNLRSTTLGCDSYKIDGRTLCTNALAVQV